MTRVLSLYAGSFGSAYGYFLGGASEVVCVDTVQRQDVPEGPFEFIKADVRDVLTDTGFLRGFDLVDASAPCKVHTRLGHLRDAQGGKPIHGDLVGITRDGLDAAGVRYVLENVEGAPLRRDVVLCGSMFGLHVEDETGRRWLKRHRVFELGGWGMLGIGIQPECRHKAAGVRPLGVYATKGDDIPAGGQTCRTLEQARELMGMPWASWAGITQAIPPAYTSYLMGCLLAELAAASTEIRAGLPGAVAV